MIDSGPCGVAVLGGINQDLVARVEGLPLPGQTLHARRLDISAGGKGLNQAVAAARFGARVTMLGAVGDDAAGASLMAVMAQAGCATHSVSILPDEATGQAFICLSEDGENTIVVNAGANASFGADALRDAFEGPVAVSLTQFEASPDAIHELFSSGAAGLRILNAAPALTEHRALLAMADILVVNETELMTFASLAALSDDMVNIAIAARSLLAFPSQEVVVTLGAKGCLLVSANDITQVPAIQVDVVDTIGAGDCFCCVFAAAVAEGMSRTAALRWATAAAALSVGRAGAAASSPMRHEVEAAMAADALADKS